MRSSTARIHAVLLLIAVAVVVVYWPSLHHLPRADHATYYTGTYEIRGLGALVRHDLSYNNERFVARGDRVLYRPLLWLMWPAEEAVFGRYGAGVQAVGILLHLAIVLLAFRLM